MPATVGSQIFPEFRSTKPLVIRERLVDFVRDAFASGFLYGHLAGWPLERAARIGNACGAIVVTRHGCANFMPTLPEVEEFVASKGGW